MAWDLGYGNQEFKCCYVLLFILLEASTMYGSVPHFDGRARVWVKDASAHLKGAYIFLIYEFPKRLSFIATMGLKFHPHFKTILINTLGMYLSNSALQLPISLSLRYVHCFISGLSPKRQSLIIIYIWVYKGRSKPHCFLPFFHL